MKKLIVLCFTVSAMAFFSAIHPLKANAHVLVMDTTGQHGAVLHMTPDDDPIAGKPATLFFDMQDNLIDSTSNVSLAINKAGDSEPIAISPKRHASLATAEYTFPTQGLYSIRYTVATGKTQYIFTNNLRVSRGNSIRSLEKPHYIWAEGLLYATGALTILLLILIWNRKDSIARQSTF